MKSWGWNLAVRILVVEDDPLLGEMMEEFLSEQEFEITLASNAKEALDLAYERPFDLWILDVKLPGGDGFSLLKSLREAGKTTPAIYTTSLHTLQDLESGYESGCDDYLKKPFELKELLVRIKALLKRRFAHKQEEFEELGGGWRFCLGSKRLYQGEDLYSLASKEIELLSLFLQNKNRLLSHEEIFDRLWSYGESPSEMSLRAYVKNLRKILGKERILNQRGEGYLYVG